MNRTKVDPAALDAFVITLKHARRTLERLAQSAAPAVQAQWLTHVTSYENAINEKLPMVAQRYGVTEAQLRRAHYTWYAGWE
jgi:hypothetical protein